MIQIEPYWALAIPGYMRAAALAFFLAGAFVQEDRAVNAISAGLFLWGLSVILPNMF
jgi:hypothetical protein